MKTDETTLPELTRAATRAACRIERKLSQDGPPTYHVVAADGWAAARFLRELCLEDEGRPGLIAAGATLSQGARSKREVATRVADFVRNTVRFEKEEGEIFQTPAHTMKIGVGDCDDHARLVRGLLAHASPKLESRLAFLHKVGGGPRHVYAEVMTEKGWEPIETTCEAVFGEPPLDAARRLGLIRSDIGKDMRVTTMGFWDDFGPGRFLKTLSGKAEPSKEAMGSISPAPTITRDWSDAAILSLIALADALGIPFEGLFEVVMSESDGYAWALAGGGGKGGASGLSQIMPANFASLGIPDDGGASDNRGRTYRSWTPERQIPYVGRYLKQYAPIQNATELYLLNFLPADRQYAAQPSFVLVARGGRRGSFYEPNKGLDHGGKGYITVDDLTMALANQRKKPRLRELLTRGYALSGRTPSSPSSRQTLVTIAALTLVAGGIATWLDPTLTSDILRAVRL